MPARRRVRRQERGYALFFVCFLAAVMIIATWAVVPDIITQARRQKEEEMIWRGEQYARAVRLYYRKNGRFPQSLEDLSKSRNQIRFLRQEYKDPFNTKDGKWRLLYIGPNGQIIGSVKNSALGAFNLAGGAPRLSDRPGTEQRPVPNAPPSKSGASAGASGGTGTVFGGNIIGVGSTIDRKSLKVYRDGITYREWEFYWDPTADRGGGQSVPGAPNVPGTPGGQQPAPGQRPRP